MCGRILLSSISLTVLVVQWLEASSMSCFNGTNCETLVDKNSAKCCNAFFFEKYRKSSECQFVEDCSTAGMGCCDCYCKAQSMLTQWSLYSQLAVAIPLSLLFFFVLVICICSHHPNCPIYKASNRRRRTGIV